jgi:23S rRNA (uracil1939-C5)-methyltransferase
VRVELLIDGLAPGGEGVGRADGRLVFVPFTAPGDRVAVELPAGEGAAHAGLLELLSPGPVRETPPCPHFGPEGDRCGGCEWMHATALAQLAAKGRAVREAVRTIGRIDPAPCWRPPLASPEPLGYRSRARLHLDRAGERLVFFRRRSHAPVPVEACLLLTPGLESLRRALGPALVSAGLAPRAVALEWSDHQRRGAAHLMLASVGAAERRRAEALLAAEPRLGGLVLTGEGRGAPALLGDPVLHHRRDPGDPAAGLCRSRPDVFQQANRGANAALVRLALDLLRPDGEEVLELFCGAGNFTLPLARRARAVAAVEGQGPALELARADAAGEPAGERIRFFAGDALALAAAFARERGAAARRFGAALLDPPRDGARGVGAVLRALGVSRAVSVSCDPATFARDLKGAVEAGFRVEALQAVDLFPQTHHVEALALLTR